VAGAVVVAGAFVVDEVISDAAGGVTPVRGQNDQARARTTITAATMPHMRREDGSCVGTDWRSGRLKSFVMAFPPLQDKPMDVANVPDSKKTTR
jgi:hypothetical protein